MALTKRAVAMLPLFALSLWSSKLCTIIRPDGENAMLPLNICFDLSQQYLNKPHACEKTFAQKY